VLQQTLIRFLIGGVVVSVFAAIGSLMKPKSFAGLFGAAPSIALATLDLTVVSNGRVYAATEARSMTVGAVAFLVYTSSACWFMMRLEWKALATTTVLMPLWLVSALGLWCIFLR
jgi:hypothetical protein